VSIDDIDKIPRTADEIRAALHGVTMPYEIAVNIDCYIDAIGSLALAVKTHHENESRELRGIVEGLLANWPHAEIAKHYVPAADRPVLTKDEALLRASRVIKGWI
jgi:hypothetical protein